jgi:hypothetical protein
MNKLFALTHKSFTNKAKIQFLGKRSLLPNQKHKQHSPIHHAMSEHKSQPPKFSFIYRTPFSPEEIETINIGGPSKFTDWNKIKLKQKIK